MIILNCSIDVTKIDKTKLIKGEKGTYLNLDVILNDQPNEWGKDVSVSLAQTKEEREVKAKRSYLGSGKKVFDSKLGKPTETTKTRNGITTTDDMPF